jgi:sensor histidine kinase YesM
MIFANLLISILPIIVIAIIFFNIFLNTIERYVSDSVELYFNQVGHRLEEYLNTVNIVADSVFFDKNLQELIISSGVSYWDKYNEIDKLFQSYLNFFDSFTDIYLMDKKQDIYHSRSVVVRDEFKDFITNLDMNQIKDGKLYIKGPIKTKDGEAYFIAYRLIRSVFFENFLEELAVGAVILDGNKLLNIIEENNLPEKSYVFIQDQGGKVVTTTNRQITDNYIRRQLAQATGKYVNINDENYMVKSSELRQAGWTIRALINRDKLIEEGHIIQYTIMVIVLLVFIVVVVITLIFNYRMTYPLKKMADAFDRVATGDFNYKLRFEYKNEITNIEDNFNNMIRELENLTNRLLQSQKEAHQIELEKKQFQLDGLQAQINAHFLYNTLNTIRVMALTDAKKEVDTMIKNLVDYLRYISRINEFVTLRDELKQLNKYKTIEQLRFGDKFKVKYKIEAGLEELKIIKLTIQPIVENAIFHGLRQSPGRGIIQISAYKQGEKAIIRVMDNGKGIKPAELQNIREDICSKKPLSQNGNDGGIGIGLVNIHKRIQLYFGEEYGLTVKSWEGIGTVVTVNYPFTVKGDEDNV